MKNLPFSPISAFAPVVESISYCFGVAGVYSFCAPFYSHPCEFLTGFSAASGIALISSVAHLGGFVGPLAIGFITQRTGNLYGGLVLAGTSLFTSAMLILALPTRTEQQAAGGVSMAQPSPAAVMPAPDIK